MPRGWEEGWDSAHCRKYYFNRATEERCWKPPVAGMPRGWEEGWDSAHGRKYYFNRATEERCWKPPASMRRPESGTAAATGAKRKDIEDRGQVMCKMGCGRPAAAGKTKNGNNYDTCCRGCASGGDHDSSCGCSAMPRRQDVPPMPSISPKRGHSEHTVSSGSGTRVVKDLGGHGPDLF
jgi:hypothetical protein